MANSKVPYSDRRYIVVNCFQISNFVLWQTAWTSAPRCVKGLWIAFKLVILSYGKQLTNVQSLVHMVVNCFQISNFVLWQTATSAKSYADTKLWIAFKLVILSYGKQPNINLVGGENSCELLSSNFVLWQTACGCCSSRALSLWIAFKLVILSYGKQRKQFI